MDKPLRPMANRFCGCFRLWPRLCCFLVLFPCFLRRNASLAGGFAGRRVLVVLCFCVCCSHLICLRIWTNRCPCTNVFFADCFGCLAFGAGGCLFWTDVVDTLSGSGLGWCLESVFLIRTQLNFIPHPLYLGIDREGTAKS